VGEVREQDDWRALLRIAGSGHLVVTTAHAGSITEAIGLIARGVGAGTAARRSEVAEKILAVLHVKATQIGGTSVLVPAVWRRTNQGVKEFVASGLSSILPFNPELQCAKPEGAKPEGTKPHGQENLEDDLPEVYYSFGRRYFANRLVEAAGLRQELKEKVRRSLDRLTLFWDLKGV